MNAKQWFLKQGIYVLKGCQYHPTLKDMDKFKNQSMKRQTVIVVITPTKTECWGNFKKACIAHNWAYNTLSKRQLPIEYDGCKIERVPFL